METRPLTRRRFVAGAAGTGALLACAGVGATEVFAEGGQIGADARPESRQIHTICQGCSNACGFTAYTVEGELGKTIGDATNPHAVGQLCARGYGYTQSAFSEANVKNPLRRLPNGSFEAISWEEAYGEIANKLDAVLNTAGPEAVALVTDGVSPTASAYGERFMAAIGSGNVFVDDAVTAVSKAAAFSQVIGADDYAADIASSDAVLLIDTSFADVCAPDLVAALQSAREAGTPVFAVDPRQGTLASFADQWLAVNPGTELALLLAVCNELIRNGRYDKAYVAANASGFDEWANAISGFTARWAEDITGVQSYRIESLASALAAAAPKVAIQYGNGRIAADAYLNSSETARVVCLLNTLLGAWNVEGGARLPFDHSAAAFSAVLPKVDGAATIGSALSLSDGPLGRPFGGGTAMALELMANGTIEAAFIVDADIAYDYASMDVARALDRTDLVVCISQQMTETAELADYVLPEASYLECASLPVFDQGMTAAVSIANPVIEGANANAKPVSDIIAELGRACGLDKEFDFTLEEASALQLARVGIALEGLQQEGTAALPNSSRRKGWATPTGKIQCASAACEEAGLSAAPVWVPPLMASNVREVIEYDENFGQHDAIEAIVDEEQGHGAPELRLKLISGQQPVIGPRGYDTAELMDIAEKYALDSLWINAQVAELLGIRTGDEVGIQNELASFTGRAFVTQRIAPTAVYLPAGFGHEGQQAASGKGIDPALFSVAVVREAYGTLCAQEACVSLWKEGE